MINFLEVEEAVKNLRQQSEAGTIDHETLEAQLLALIDVGTDGFYWMIGHKTGQWYRHDGQQWLANNPGELLVARPNPNAPNNSNRAAHHGPPSSPQMVASHWDSVDINWFLVGLMTIGAIFTVIYSSAL